MIEGTELSYIMNIYGYDIFIEQGQQELFELALAEDAPIDLSVWIRVILKDDAGIFDYEKDEDMLINTTYHGKISNLESELKRLISSEQFQKKTHFDFDLDKPYQQQLPFTEN